MGRLVIIKAACTEPWYLVKASIPHMYTKTIRYTGVDENGDEITQWYVGPGHPNDGNEGNEGNEGGDIRGVLPH